MIDIGEFRKVWDWGQIYPHHPPLLVGKELPGFRFADAVPITQDAVFARVTRETAKPYA